MRRDAARRKKRVATKRGEATASPPLSLEVEVEVEVETCEIALSSFFFSFNSSLKSSFFYHLLGVSRHLVERRALGGGDVAVDGPEAAGGRENSS